MDDTLHEAGEKLTSLARDVLRLSRNTLVINLRFMDSAISRLDWVPFPGTLAVDGEHILYDSIFLLKLYAQETANAPRAYLHMVLHCVFRHFLVSPTIQRDLWNIACDMAVEAMITELNISSLQTTRESAQRTVLQQMQKHAGQLTAEKIYHYLRTGSINPAELQRLSGLFSIDDHTVWYLPDKAEITVGGSQGDNEQDQGAGDGQENNRDSTNNSASKSAALGADWQNVAERMQMDLETFSKQRGDQAGNMMQNLKEVNREKYDYTAFLKKFAVMGEVMKINDDEFDYIFYTYGMQLFPEKRMPLIEPLEYKDVKRIREFVIAIDTSGSVAGELVQTFLQKTYNILKSTESFFSRIKLHIIQCDAAIQEDVKITTQEEFDRYLQNMTIKGLGGTDFRPVFEQVNKMIAEREFTNLKGLIYFTDGYGDFPEKMPAYKTAFVFIDDDYNNLDVPPWAIKLILRKDEI